MQTLNAGVILDSNAHTCYWAEQLRYYRPSDMGIQFG
jgi:hypothetical protein